LWYLFKSFERVWALLAPFLEFHFADRRGFVLQYRLTPRCVRRWFLAFFTIPFLATGLQAAPDPLHTVGNMIIDLSTGCTIRFKGMNVDSLEYTNYGQGPAGPITAAVAEGVTAWGANLIRIPMSQDFWFGCTNSKVGNVAVNGANYQALVQSIVDYCSSQNVYVLLDLHWSGTQTGATTPCGTGWGNATQQQYMPDDNSVTFWTSVASMPGIQNNPAVLFDIYNEPFDYDSNGSTIWLSGGTGTSYTFHTPGFQTLLNTVRSAGANNIAVAGGLDYAYDLTEVGGTLLDTASGNGVIYSCHIYPYKGSNPWVPTDGDNVTGTTAAHHPVLIGEFGQSNGSPDSTGAWDETLLQWINGNQNNVLGNGSNPTRFQYSATAWDMSTGSCPCLVSDSNYTPTAWHGVPVQNWLATPNIPTCAPTPTSTPLPCNYPGPTCTPTQTPTPTITFTPTATSGIVNVPYPNPWPDKNNPSAPLQFNYTNSQQAGQVDLKIYTLAFRKVFEDDGLMTAPGSYSYVMDWAKLNDVLANGLYYFVIETNPGANPTRKIMKVLIER
jgi:hypothetical protein